MSTQAMQTPVENDVQRREEDSVPAQPARQEKPSKSPTAFRTISEVADELAVQQHVLRFWETKFSQVRPLKRGGGRRYYRPEDVDLLKKIHHLLYTEGYTIKGVQKLLREVGKNRILQGREPKAPQPSKAAPPVAPEQKPGLNARQKSVLQDMLGELKELRSLIKTEEE